MKTDNDRQEKMIDELFRAMPLEKYSVRLTGQLLHRIEKEVIKEQRKRTGYLVLQIAAGVIAMLVVPGLILYLCTLIIPDFSVSFAIPNIPVSPFSLLTGLTVLVLLITDTLLRKRMHDKKHNGH
jgi:hypothetical protein